MKKHAMDITNILYKFRAFNEFTERMVLSAKRGPLAKLLRDKIGENLSALKETLCFNLNKM